MRLICRWGRAIMPEGPGGDLRAAGRRVAVIGAGLAGLTAARGLSAAGHDVECFDKARGPGGRISTRRAEPYAFDHGAQYFTARSSAFADIVAEWCQAGVAAEWAARFAVLGEGGKVEPRPARSRFVGVPRMSAIARHLSRDLTFHPSSRVAALRRGDRGWSVELDSKRSFGGYDAVIVAVPAPQAVPLLESAAHGAMVARARDVTMSPCHAMMLAFDAPVELPWDAALVEGSPIAWIARNASKPGRGDAETFVIHSDPAWSASRLEEASDRLMTELVEALERLIARPLPRAVHADLHRWRFAQAPTPSDEMAAWDEERGIGLCGDWMCGARVEAAWQSGAALAAAVLEHR